MNRESRTPSDLVARARAGDVVAFDALYLSCQAGIYSFIRSQVREEELAADLTQQTFVRAWESLPRLKEAGAFLGWLHRIAANLVRDEVKSGRARLEVIASEMADDPLAPPATPPGPEEAAISAGLQEAVWAAIAELSADQRGVVVMHHLEDMSVAEIARALGVRPGTVMSRLARAREALRKRLSGYLEDSDVKL
jgi:RNA polymerase sigma-70 factor (ECF subfamily)